jgi:hypothetical protein
MQGTKQVAKRNPINREMVENRLYRNRRQDDDKRKQRKDAREMKRFYEV